MTHVETDTINFKIKLNEHILYCVLKIELIEDNGKLEIE